MLAHSTLKVALIALLSLTAVADIFAESLVARRMQALSSSPDMEVRALQQNEEKNMTHKQNDEKSSEEKAKKEIIVSPEFTLHNETHAHSQSDDARGDAFEDYITSAFTELNNYVPSAPIPIDSITPTRQNNKSEQSSSDDGSAIPNLSQLRNISIDELPLEFP